MLFLVLTNFTQASLEAKLFKCLEVNEFELQSRYYDQKSKDKIVNI